MHRTATGLAAAAVVLLSLPAAPSLGAADDGEPGARAKASYIARFPAFISWPDSVLAPGDTVVVGVLGDTPVLPALRRRAAQERNGGRPLAVRACPDVAAAARCHLLFVAPSAADTLDGILAPLAGRPVLTVGDVPGFAGRGGHLSFFREDGRLRFALDPRACARSGLGLSFRLRNVARIVE